MRQRAEPSVPKAKKRESAAIKSYSAAEIKKESVTHGVACSVLSHVGEYSDVRLVTQFIETIPDRRRKNALKVWFKLFGPVFFDGDKAKYKRHTRGVLLGKARETPFWCL
jgi:hypothetical protein